MVILTGIMIASFAALFAFSEFFSRYVRGRLPAAGQFLDLPDGRAHYFSSGTSGPPLVLIHGLTGSAQNFTYALVERLARDHRVFAVDRPGSGYSSPSNDSNLHAQAKWIADFIRAKNLNRPLLVGHSLGGAVALRLALDEPSLISGAALIAPLTQMQDEIPLPFRDLRIRSRFLRWLYARTLATPLAILRGREKGRLVFHPDLPPRDFGVKGGAFVSADYKSYLGGAADLVSLENHLENLANDYVRLKTPVSILYGDEDQILDPKLHGEKMRPLGQHVHVEFVHGGHMLVGTHPDLVRDFIVASETRANAGLRD